jgi:hypothetical protein
MHIQCPFPSTSIRAELAFLTGKTPKQVDTFFYNARKRKKELRDISESKRIKLIVAAEASKINRP